MHGSKFLGKWSQSICLSLFVVGIGLWITDLSASLSLAQAQPLSSMIPTFTTSQKQILQSLETANIIYLGETHDRLADHQAQLTIIETLHRKQPQMAIALEMFQKPYQVWLTGALSEEQLLTQTEYQQRWGFDWNFYAPIFRFARAKDLPLLAINTPSEITRKVARLGLESLQPEDFKWIPPRSEIDLSSVSYRKRILETYESFHHGKGNSDGFERFFQAQVLWDETMAEAIAQYWLKHPNDKIVVLVGQGHILFGEGIPSRVERRLKMAGHKNWKQVSVLLNPSQEIKNASIRAADFFWFSEAQP